MSISRSKKRNSTGIPNSLLNDSTLSFRARGLASFILSKPDDWRIDSAALARTGKDGRHAILSALTELEKAGYLRRHRAQGERGLWASWSTLYETVEDAIEAEGPVHVELSPKSGNPTSDDPKSEHPASGEPTSGNPTSTSLAREERIETLAPTDVDAVEISLRSAVLEACAIDSDRITRSAEGVIAKAVNDLIDAGATPADVPAAAKSYRDRFPAATLTPAALAKHWPLLLPNRARAVPEISPAERFGRSLGLTEPDYQSALDQVLGEFDDDEDRVAALNAYSAASSHAEAVG